MRQVDAHTFRDIIAHMKGSMKPPLGFSLHLHSVAEYREMVCMVDETNMHFGAGFAVHLGRGELVNGYSIAKGNGDRLVQEAIRIGATNLDCYDGPLFDLYSRNGFVEVNREKWDDAYADPRWDKKLWGTPDVVFMEYKTELD